ncbi:MAG: 3-oxoacyl-[acyl-carrier-protein] synthase II, partial [Porticoccaceae bacterium]
MTNAEMYNSRIVITGVGLTSPIGDSLTDLRANLLAGKSGVTEFETRYMPPVLAGVCNFDALRHQKRKEVRRGTRAGSIAVYCANEAINDAGFNWENVEKDRVGVYLGITEH